MLSDAQLIEKAIQKFKENDGEVLVTNAFVTEATDHTRIVVLRNDDGVLANFQVLDKDKLFRLDQPNTISHKR